LICPPAALDHVVEMEVGIGTFRRQLHRSIRAAITAVRQIRQPRRDHAPPASVGVEAPKIEADGIHDGAS
jgi:hypothetical protein